MVPGDEPEVLRQYRHLLRTASADWQETAHRHALTALGPDDRAGILAEVQRLLLAGTRLEPDHVHALARLLVLAERRRPGVLLDGMRPDLLERLSTAVVGSPIGQMLRAGYDVWDGVEPKRPFEPPVEVDHHQGWFRQWATPGTFVEGSVFYPAPTSPPRRTGT
jgi:hypothetical protein